MPLYPDTMKRTFLLIPFLLLGAAEPTGCPQDMVRVPKTQTCMDRYEWPNRQGVRPSVAMSAVRSIFDKDDTTNAESLCEGVGKRMCKLEEWIPACKGKRNTDYPFGRRLPKPRPVAEQTPCNYGQHYRKPNNHKVFMRDAKELARLNQSDKSGTRQCESGSGAHDMMGNVEEWIRCPGWLNPSGSNCVGSKAKGTQVCYCLAGRYWSAPVMCHEMIAGHAAAFHDYETGFRCCKDAD